MRTAYLSNTPLSTGPHLLILPKQFHQLLPSFHIYEPMGITFIQTTKIKLFCFVFKLLVRGWRDGSGIDRVLYVSRWAFYCFNETHFHITVIMEGSQSRNLEAETDAMKCCLLKCLPLMAYSTCFLMRPQDHLWGMAPPTISWALPHQSKIKKMHNRYAYRQILWRHFPNWNFLFPNDYLVSSWHKTSRHTALAKDLSSIPVTLIR